MTTGKQFVILFSALLLLAMAGFAMAGPFEDGEAAYKKGDNATAVPLLIPLAEQGNTAAQFYLGQIFYHGGDVPQDYVEAAKWWRLAAEQGQADAQYSLGLIYTYGEGVTQDYVEAVKWWLLAADQGYVSAQFNLGQMYEDGKGVPQDLVEAVKWWRLAADQGNALAQLNLGVCYNSGKCVPQDYVLAHFWYNLSASLSAPEARNKAVEYRDNVADLMTPDQIAEAQRLARDWEPN